MLKLRKFDLHENLQKLYAKQLSHRFNIETYVAPPPKEGVMSLSSTDGHWIIYIDTFSWLKKLYPEFSKFSKKDSLLRLSKSIFSELTDMLIIPELSRDISFCLSEDEVPSLEGKLFCCFESEVGFVFINQMPLSRASVELNSLFHTVEFSLGSSYLSLESLKKISIGDIIIVQTLCNLILCNQENIGDYIVNDNNEVQMNIHSDSDEIVESQDTLSPIKLLEYDDINVKVEFVLAEKRMTLNDLKRYVSDEVFKLPENVVQEVKIKVNGSLVGRGELVSIENGYGIEVTSWMVKETVHAE
ncbi:FliM/FliN family flagellar motor switch protein [Escherichia fergusonii]|uniref:FliM/FliN family flagellar motor switch protein n=1 Tax=Escherichia fergusonii TaxID=564 RepID=UPI001ED1ED9D|nr:hypothetical protein [Escherichia fergusonii]EHJ4135603.1 hypothetical protein [Escherichia fergusonii]